MALSGLRIVRLVLARLFVVSLESFLDVLVVGLDHLERILDSLQTQGLVGFWRSINVLLLAESLNLFASVSNFDESQRGRRALEEVAERRELLEVLELPAETNRRASSIEAKVSSACSKKPKTSE
jgi:hypothetical protein